ncbi:MAG TPA: transporter substrate-binding domain-containing protein [Alphaproteobacteria bacterium]|nr:transporter substrate-binding domain-containing protein [Alphaproteobacteria bacterium]
MRRSILVAALLLAAPAAGQTLALPETAPWASREADGRIAGLGVDIARLIAEEAGMPEARLVAMPGARVAAELAAGAADFTLTPRWPGGESAGPFLAETLVVPFAAFARRGVALARPEDLRGLETVAIMRGIRYGTAAESDPAIRWVEEKDLEQALRKLAAGRIDAVAGTSVAILAVARRLGLEEALGDRLRLGAGAFWLQAGPAAAGTPAAGALAAAIGRLRADGRIDALVARHAGPDWQVLPRPGS